MHPNALGAAASSLKSIIPGSNAKEHPYRLIKKVDQGKESLIFIDDFIMILDKIFIAYETDMITPGEWSTIIVSYEDLYKAVVRENAIYLKGEILGMQVEMFQRPALYEDIVKIDGIEFPLPLKLAIYESELAEKAEKAKEQAVKEAKKAAEEVKKEQEKEALLRELAQKEENKAYIALLIKMQLFDTSYKSEIIRYFPNEEIQQLINTCSIEELEKKSKNHDKYFNKYEIFR